nr:reverse transcriptase domain-containing protein [Tanacetum cinerariifolium]
MLSGFFQNQFSTSGTLLSDTIPNPKDEMKAIATGSGVAYEGPSIPTPKKVVERETKETTDKEQTNFQGTMLLKKLPEKLRDPGKFVIPCDFLGMDKKLFLPELTPTRMTLELADRSIARPKGVAEDVFVKVGKFHFQTDFVVANFKADPREILGLSKNSSGGNPTSTSEPILSDSSHSLTPFEGSDFILEEIEAYLKDELNLLEIDHADCDPEGDICLIEKLFDNLIISITNRS